MLDKESLKSTLKEQLIKYLNLLDLSPEDISDAEPLFGENLGLDSIDSIEMIVLLEREYGLKIKDPKEGRKILETINSMADYIIANKKD